MRGGASTKGLAPWLFGTAGLTLGMVGGTCGLPAPTRLLTLSTVGGMTRLTESGLSITEWKPVTGALPPLSTDDWQRE